MSISNPEGQEKEKIPYIIPKELPQYRSMNTVTDIGPAAEQNIVGWVRCGDLGGLHGGCGTLLSVHRREEMYYLRKGIRIFKESAATGLRKRRD